MLTSSRKALFANQMSMCNEMIQTHDTQAVWLQVSRIAAFSVHSEPLDDDDTRSATAENMVIEGTVSHISCAVVIRR